MARIEQLSPQSLDTDISRAAVNTVIEGHVSVSASLRAGVREIETVYVRRDRRDRAVQVTVDLARRRGVAVAEVSDEQIAEIASGQSHGGIAAVVGPRRFVELTALAADRKIRTVVMLDGIEDPYNFGSCVRSLYAAGIDALILRRRNWMSAAGVVTRASAGATELIAAAVVDTAEDAAEVFGKSGFAIACTSDVPTAIPMRSADLRQKTFLLIGGEKRGITRSFLSRADLILRIPYGRSTDIALDAASATAVLAFEIQRQRAEVKTEPGAAPAVNTAPDLREDEKSAPHGRAEVEAPRSQLSGRRGSQPDAPRPRRPRQPHR